MLKPEEVLQAASENRWMNSVLSAAEVGAEALQLQVISKDQLIARLQDQGRIDIQAMRDHEQALLKRVELLGDELSQLGIENERKRVEIERLSNVTVAVQDELSLVKNSLAHTQNELAHEQAQRQIMLNSNSWRITKPLRWFMQLFSSNQS